MVVHRLSGYLDRLLQLDISVLVRHVLCLQVGREVKEQFTGSYAFQLKRVLLLP